MDGAYCSVANVKMLLEKKPSTVRDDGTLQLLVDGASRAARSFIGMDILAAEHTEVRNGTGTGVLMLRHRPVTALHSVAVGIPSATRTVLLLNTDYVWDDRCIQLVNGGVFNRGVANVAVSYAAGWADIPGDIRAAVAKWAATKFRELDRLGETSKSTGPQSITFDVSAIPKDVAQVLGMYQSLTPV